MTQEFCTIVDENDQEVGVIERRQSVADRQRVRIVLIYVIDPATGEVGITQRAPNLRYLPLAWQPAAGGYVMHGESWDTALARELQEELGLTAPILPLEKFPTNDTYSGLPFMATVAVVSGTLAQLRPDPQEIVATRFLPLLQLEAMMETLGEEQKHGLFPASVACLRRHWGRVQEFVAG